MMDQTATTFTGLIHNRAAFRAVFRQFVLLCRRLDLYDRELLAVDAARIRQSKIRTATTPAVR
jgi:hypothetical protein